MVAKSLVAAAFLLSCTLAWGECPDGKCSSGKCQSTECKSGECSEGDCTKCSDEAGCSDEKCATGECPFAKCAKSECAKSECAKSECAKGECAEGACAKSECSKGKCAKSDCVAGECAKGKCSKSKCSTAECSLAKCTTDESSEACCAGEGCPLTKCASEAIASLKCAIETGSKCSKGECSESKCSEAKNCKSGKCGDKTCSDKPCSGKSCGEKTAAVAKKCSSSECAGGTCATLKCAELSCASVDCVVEYPVAPCQPSQSPLEVKLAALQQLEREIAEFRESAGRPEQLKVSVKVVEINHTACRKLGFDLQTASTPSCEVDSQVIESLEKNNLLKVIANPTLALTGGRAGQFVSGIETPLTVGSDQHVEREFIGTRVDVLATPMGNGKVRVEIRPEISELDLSKGGRIPTVKVRYWDTAFETTLGKTVAMNGLPQTRVRARREGDRVVEEVEEIESLLLVTVESATPAAPAISQAAYEEALVSLVQEPECVTKVYPVPDLQVWKVRPGGVEFDAELLMNHLQSSVAPKSWRCEVNPDAEATIEVFERNGSLVVRQTEENHQAIAAMLTELRRSHGEAEAECDAPCSALKADGKCAVSEALKCSAVDVSTTEVKLACGKRFVELPNAEVEEEPYPIGECSTGFSVEPRCHDGQCTR